MAEQNGLNVISEVEKIQKQIDTLTAQPPETLAPLGIDKAKTLEALRLALKNAERAKEAAIDRAKTKLFIAHYVSGCPECGHHYRASDEEIKNYINVREASVNKL